MPACRRITVRKEDAPSRRYGRLAAGRVALEERLNLAVNRLRPIYKSASELP